MGILNKLLSGSGSKHGARLKQAERLLGSGKLAEAADALSKLGEELAAQPDDGALSELRQLELRLFNSYVNEGDETQALALGEKLAQTDDASLRAVADKFADKLNLDPRALGIILHAADLGEKERRMLLSVAKQILNKHGEDVQGEELHFVIQTAKAFPLWKEGLSVLADRYLKEGRRDSEALSIYRGAYPNRKADRRLRAVLLESLIADGTVDDFAAAVYRDAVETSDNPQALKLLAEHYIKKGEFSPSTSPYVQRAMEKATLSESVLKRLSELVLVSKSDFFNRLELCLAIYRQGYSDRNLLAFLAENLSQANRFDAEAIEVMTRAFELRMVSKRSILILTEHCLANDREDDFALRVYESYLSTWPDRPQRRIYSILAHHYAALTRVDEQAQKIYEEALEDGPTDTVVITILARAYHAADRRDETAEEVYRHAFPLVEAEIKRDMATVLAEMKCARGDFNEDTLQYLTLMGRPASGPLKNSFDEALTNCFLSTGRRGEQAQQAYFALFEKAENSAELNPRLVTLLAEIIKERGVKPAGDSIEMRVYRKLFDLQKFSTDPEISFVLLEDALGRRAPKSAMINIAVRCFEADEARLIEAVRSAKAEQLLTDIGDFYIEHYNFEHAARALEASYDLAPSDTVNYRLCKIHLLENRAEHALEHLNLLTEPEYAVRRTYWEGAAQQQLGQYKAAAETLAQVAKSPEIPPFLLKLRQAINLELSGALDPSLRIYDELISDLSYPQFERWIQLERGIVMMKLKRWEAAREHLEEIHRRNPNGRAEQQFYSLVLFYLGLENLRSGNIDLAMPLFTRAVEVNRNHRLLRQVIVEVLSHYGERSFFEGQLPRAAKILEVAHRILPKRTETKIYLAYSYHRMLDYAKAIINYRDIAWSDDNPRLQLSQAYAYLSHNKPEKAWRVFLDLTRRGNLMAEQFPRLVGCFLADPEGRGGLAWEPVKFPEGIDQLMLCALLIHDGQYQRAADLLEQLAKGGANLEQVRWYLGRAYAQMGKRELAVHNWRELLKLCLVLNISLETKIRQLTEIGLAFLNAGYAQEAMLTWDELRKLDEKNPDLPPLYAATLDLNAYQLARKDQDKMACEEWKKALSYDPENPHILQNSGICNLLLDDYEEATRQFHKLTMVWQQEIKQNPRRHGALSKAINFIERALNTLALTKGRPEHDLTKVRAEDAIEYYQKANQFYWILGLDKRAAQLQIEHEYFRLIKIFNPERHADDFMLVEESYTNLFKDPERRLLIDLFVFNPVDVELLRKRLKHLPRTGEVSFEQLALPTSVPPPDFSQLTMTKATDEQLAQPLSAMLQINFKIPDWTIL